MKNPMQKLRRFFVRSRTYDTTAARTASHAPADDDDGGHRLSGAFIVVLLLHIIAVAGVFAFARVKENRSTNEPRKSPAPAAPQKSGAAKPAAAAAPAVGGVRAGNSSNDSQKPAAGSQIMHVVKEGDTLTKIAAAYSVNVSDVVSANKLRNQDDIHKGQSLLISNTKTAASAENRNTAPPTQKPAQATERKTAKNYTVKKGDSPVKIAREHGCSYEELMKLNGIKDPKKIQTGQVLKLPVKNG